jgi:hypothetical protein
VGFPEYLTVVAGALVILLGADGRLDVVLMRGALVEEIVVVPLVRAGN